MSEQWRSIPDFPVRHLDGTRTNNAVSNLAYGTRSENTYDAIRHNTHANARKTHCPAGHPYDVVTDRARRCSTCAKARARAYRALADSA